MTGYEPSEQAKRAARVVEEWLCQRLGARLCWVKGDLQSLGRCIDYGIDQLGPTQGRPDIISRLDRGDTIKADEAIALAEQLRNAAEAAETHHGRREVRFVLHQPISVMPSAGPFPNNKIRQFRVTSNY